MREHTFAVKHHAVERGVLFKSNGNGQFLYIFLCCSNKKLLVTKGIVTRSKDATRGSWPYY